MKRFAGAFVLLCLGVEPAHAQPYAVQFWSFEQTCGRRGWQESLTMG